MGVTVGAPLVLDTVTDTQWVVDRVGEGGRVQLPLTDTLPLPLPTSLMVRVPLPWALPEKVWETVQLKVPLPLRVPALAVGGLVPMDAWPLGEGDTDQEAVGVTEKVEVEEAEALGVEEVEAEALEEGVVEGEVVPLPLSLLLGVVAAEEERVGLGRLEREGRALPLTMGAKVDAEVPVSSPLRLKAPLGVPTP